MIPAPGRAATSLLSPATHETGELATYDNIRRACRIALLAGGDFLKTSTGKVAPASTMPVVLLMLEAARENGVEAWYLLAKDEGHGFRKKSNRDYQAEAETLFLDKVLNAQ